MLWLSVMAVCLCACSPRALHEAQDVVAQADSLRAEGQLYTDSARLAQACSTLGHRQLFYPTEYTHACYHYGRLLREQDNPVDAMQAFIHATHTRTRDYHILGRVYSNMGDMCHLAGEFALSYDMFEKSADCFLQNADTLSYYYALNDMAFELAEQGKKEEANAIISRIENACKEPAVRTKLLETQAELYKKCHQYDSAIYYTNKLFKEGYSEPTGFLIKAQVFSYMLQKDSALIYAQKALSQTKSINEQYNALYILSHDDSTLLNSEIIKLTSLRDDIHTFEIEVRKTKHAKAILLLQQDIHRKPDLRWLYTLIATLIIVGAGISIYVFNKRKKHRLLSQKVDELQQAASAIQEKHDDLSTRYTNYHQQVENEILRTCRVLRNSENITTELAWNDFDAMCQIIDRQFYMFTSKLKSKNILNETEVRLCVLVLLDMSRAEIAHTLPYALSSIGKLKDHTAKSLGTTGKNLRGFLLKLAIEG